MAEPFAAFANAISNVARRYAEDRVEQRMYERARADRAADLADAREYERAIRQEQRQFEEELRKTVRAERLEDMRKGANLQIETAIKQRAALDDYTKDRQALELGVPVTDAMGQRRPASEVEREVREKLAERAYEDTLRAATDTVRAQLAVESTPEAAQLRDVKRAQAKDDAFFNARTNLEVTEALAPDAIRVQNIQNAPQIGAASNDVQGLQAQIDALDEEARQIVMAGQIAMGGDLNARFKEALRDPRNARVVQSRAFKNLSPAMQAAQLGIVPPSEDEMKIVQKQVEMQLQRIQYQKRDLSEELFRVRNQLRGMGVPGFPATSAPSGGTDTAAPAAAPTGGSRTGINFSQTPAPAAQTPGGLPAPAAPAAAAGPARPNYLDSTTTPEQAQQQAAWWRWMGREDMAQQFDAEAQRLASTQPPPAPAGRSLPQTWMDRAVAVGQAFAPTRENFSNRYHALNDFFGRAMYDGAAPVAPRVPPAVPEGYHALNNYFGQLMYSDGPTNAERLTGAYHTANDAVGSMMYDGAAPMAPRVQPPTLQERYEALNGYFGRMMYGGTPLATSVK